MVDLTPRPGRSAASSVGLIDDLVAGLDAAERRPPRRPWSAPAARRAPRRGRRRRRRRASCSSCSTTAVLGTTGSGSSPACEARRSANMPGQERAIGVVDLGLGDEVARRLADGGADVLAPCPRTCGPGKRGDREGERPPPLHGGDARLGHGELEPERDRSRRARRPWCPAGRTRRPRPSARSTMPLKGARMVPSPTVERGGAGAGLGGHRRERRVLHCVGGAVVLGLA